MRSGCVRVQASSVPDRGDPRCVRWYCKYGISYRDLADVMQERGIVVDHNTIFRWPQCYEPEVELQTSRARPKRSGQTSRR